MSGKRRKVLEEALEEAWAFEIQRMCEIESDAVKTIPWSEVRQGILSLRDARSKY